MANPGVVTAYQKIAETSGEYAGVTGYFFVSGDKSGSGIITTRVSGEICYP